MLNGPSWLFNVIDTRRPTIEDLLDHMCEGDYASLCPNQAKQEKLRSARPHIEIDYCIVLLQSAFQGWVTLLIAEQRKDEAQTLDILRSDDLIAWCIWLPFHILPSAILGRDSALGIIAAAC